MTKQATTPVATLLASWTLRTEAPNMNKLFVVSVIVVGVIIASFGEIAFVLIGVIYQIGGVVFEALRLALVNKLLSDPSYKMDPLVSLYYYAPVCAAMNLMIALFVEVPRLTLAEVYTVGIGTFIINALIAFFLNISVVFLVSIAYWILSCVLTLLDPQNLWSRPHALRRPQRHYHRPLLCCSVRLHYHTTPSLRLQHRYGRHGLVQDGRR